MVLSAILSASVDVNCALRSRETLKASSLPFLSLSQAIFFRFLRIASLCTRRRAHSRGRRKILPCVARNEYSWKARCNAFIIVEAFGKFPTTERRLYADATVKYPVKRDEIRDFRKSFVHSRISKPCLFVSLMMSRLTQ